MDIFTLPNPHTPGTATTCNTAMRLAAPRGHVQVDNVGVSDGQHAISKTHPQSPGRGVQIPVNDPADNTITLDVEAYDTVADIKAKIQNKEGTPP